MEYSNEWKNGWIACGIDSHAITEFHRRAGELGDNDDDSSLEKIWLDICEEAKKTEYAWDALSEEEKANYPMSPFWKRNCGLPRRLSFRQKKTLTQSLRDIFK